MSRGGEIMYFLQYAALAAFVLAAVRTFSFGVYGLRRGRGGVFAVALMMIASAAVLMWFYLR